MYYNIYIYIYINVLQGQLGASNNWVGRSVHTILQYIL